MPSFIGYFMMDDEDTHAAVELPMDNIIAAKGNNICYDHVHQYISDGANDKHVNKTTSMTRVSRDGCNDRKTTILWIIIIAVIILILSAGTVYTLVQLFRLQSEVASTHAALLQLKNISSASLEQKINASLNMLEQQNYYDIINTSIEQIQARENEKEQMMNDSLDVLHQQINDLAGTLNNSIEQIQARENEKQQITNTSLDVLNQQINDLAGALNTSDQQIRVRENEKQQITNASLDLLNQRVSYLDHTFNASIEQIQLRENEEQQIINASLVMLHQQINDLFGFHPDSCAAILLLNPSSPSGYYLIRSSNGSPVRMYCIYTQPTSPITSTRGASNSNGGINGGFGK